MKLEKLLIQNFRNLSEVELEPVKDLNIIYGLNGSGKSSLLEALHYLGFARSFRTSKHQHVIQNEQDKFVLFCKAKTDQDKYKLGIQRFRNGDVQVKLNGENKNKGSDLVKLFPVQIFTPQSSDVITGTPKLRRKFLDWGLFHVEQSFFDISSLYTRCVKQRNAVLRKATSLNRAEEDFWLAKIAEAGEQLSILRYEYLEQLKPYIETNLAKFLPEFSFKISYHRGWENELSLFDSLQKNRERDVKSRYSTIGPHKAEFKFKIDAVNAADCLSRGQLRMLMAGLQLAQTQHLNQTRSGSCIFLLDDIGAELDSVKRDLFISSLLESNAQIFVTAIDKQQINLIDNDKTKKVFHVEHGQVKEEL